LLSTKGLGVVSVAGIIVEVGDFKKFQTWAEIMKLAGLDLYEISSGKWKGRRKISKRGRSLLRKILYYAAIQTIRNNGILHDYYTRLTARGMKRMMALVAVSRKLWGIIYVIVRDDSEYLANFESIKRLLKVLLHRWGDYRFLLLRSCCDLLIEYITPRQHLNLY